MNDLVTAERVNLPMICICRTQIEGTEDYDDSRRVKADTLRDKARALLGGERPCTDANFLSRATMRLSWHGAEVSFFADQWFLVSAEVQDFVKTAEGSATADDLVPVLQVSVPCDRVEDGLAALVVWFTENRPLQD